MSITTAVSSTKWIALFGTPFQINFRLFIIKKMVELSILFVTHNNI